MTYFLVRKKRPTVLLTGIDLPFCSIAERVRNYDETKIDSAPILRPSTDGVSLWSSTGCRQGLQTEPASLSATPGTSASRGIPLHLFLGTSQPEIAARARALCACPTRPQSSPIAVPRRYWNSARLRSDAFFVRNIARHGAGSHRHQRSAVSTICVSTVSTISAIEYDTAIY